MTVTSQSTAARIAQRGRLELRARLRAAFDDQAQQSTGVAQLNPDQVQRLVAEAEARADGALWRRSLAEAAIAELGIDLATAIEHPQVLLAHELVGAPPYEPPAPPAPSHAAAQDTTESPVAMQPEPVEGEAQPAAEPEPPEAGQGLEAVRISAVHAGGIESLRAGERDIELRFSDAGLDVLKRSTGAVIGRLDWSDIASIELLPPRRGLRMGRRRIQKLHVETNRGRASFELHGVTEDELTDYLRPVLERTRTGGGRPPSR
jgi:hypothetical protein